MTAGLDIAFFGSSLRSAYWNGAATYYRGLLRALAARGHRVTFYEPEAFDRHRYADATDLAWARVVVYPGKGEDNAWRALESARSADLLVKASGVGVFDTLLDRGILEVRRSGARAVFWDVDAPATLDRLQDDPADPFNAFIPRYDVVFTYGGGPPVVAAYTRRGAQRCVPIYNALDPSTHHPVPAEARFAADFTLLANRLPDRESRVEEFFLGPARRRPRARFLLGGSGWKAEGLPSNVLRLGHVYTHDHNALNCSATAVLNVNRASRARFGYAPPTRIFEAAGAGACIVSDAWPGIDEFLEPEREVLLARNGAEVGDILDRLTPASARRIGDAALRRVLSQHTYAHRADVFEDALGLPRRRYGTGSGAALVAST